MHMNSGEKKVFGPLLDFFFPMKSFCHTKMFQIKQMFDKDNQSKY